jgi:hypothetical protein
MALPPPDHLHDQLDTLNVFFPETTGHGVIRRPRERRHGRRRQLLDEPGPLSPHAKKLTGRYRCR